MLQVGQAAPPFTAQALVGKDFEELSLSDYRGKWVCLFFYPLDFTFVCPTEIVDFNKAFDEFAGRNCQIVAASTDSVYSHLGWTQADSRLSVIKYPIVSDITHQIARKYGVLIPDKGITLRGAFLIDPEGILRYQVVHDLSIGRNVAEVMRVLSGLQTGELCPAAWKDGDPTFGRP